MSALTSQANPAESNGSHSDRKPAGFLSFTLHAHLPYVVNHGTWPHGIEWLHEAAAETYLPLLRVLANLERDGIALNCSLNLSPILLEQLAHPVFKSDFPRYLDRKILAAREDEAYFLSVSEFHYAELARFWQKYFTDALADFQALNGDIIAGFRHFNDAGLIEIITCCATHGYMPLLGTDESVRAQIRTAVTTHQRHIGKHPRGIWAPECGYRPSGTWDYPVTQTDGSPIAPAFHRIGIEQAISESNIDFFVVDTHLVEESARAASPYELRDGSSAGNFTVSSDDSMTQSDHRRLYQPYYVDSPSNPQPQQHPATVFPRDPSTGTQVWSGNFGYPGDSHYLDFHKKRWPGGHRYWCVTGSGVDMADKQPYDPARALERTQAHASHFVHLVWQALHASMNDAVPPILSSPFDAELFGHWWFEGPQWLEAVARTLHDYPTGIQLTSGSQYLDRYPRAGFIKMHEGSWGAEGTNYVWMNPDTAWTYTQIYPAELYIRDLCTAATWKSKGQVAERVIKQLCRELLLIESSDWQFLITTGAARDYAELRFETHMDQFNELKSIWQHLESHGAISPEQEERLAAIEDRDSIFPDIDPDLWAAGARQQLTADTTNTRRRNLPLADPPPHNGASSHHAAPSPNQATPDHDPSPASPPNQNSTA